MKVTRLPRAVNGCKHQCRQSGVGTMELQYGLNPLIPCGVGTVRHQQNFVNPLESRTIHKNVQGDPSQMLVLLMQVEIFKTE